MRLLKTHASVYNPGVFVFFFMLCQLIHAPRVFTPFTKGGIPINPLDLDVNF